MATETDIPESVSSKKGEREDNAMSSELLEEKVTELAGSKVKQLESGPNQPLETSSHVAETVYRQLETDIPTNQGGTFFHALSVPMVIADEHSNTQESCEATTTEDQEEIKPTKIEPFTEGKQNDDERVEAVASKEASANEHQPNKGDHNVVKAISSQTEGSIVHVLGLIKGSDKDIEEVAEICNKDQSMGGSSNTKTETVNEEDLQGKNYNSEGKKPEFVKTRECLEEGTEEVRPSVETEEETEHQGLGHGITTDVCIAKQTEHEEETTENEKKNDEKAIESDDGQTEKSGRLLVKEACEETGSEKAESEEGLKLSENSSTALNKKEIASKDEDQEKEQERNTSEKDQCDDDVTSLQNATREDIQETPTSQHATTVVYLEEQDLNGRPREILKEETEDKSIDAQEASGQCENGANDKREQKPQESVNKTVPTSSEIEQEKDTKGITPSAETKERMEHQGLLNVITTDACISTQTESQVETPKHEEKDEEVIDSDDGRKEESNSPSIKEVCEETSAEKVEFEEEVKLSDNSSMKLNEKAIAILSKDEDQEKEQEVNMSEKDQGEDDVTCSQDRAFEGGLQEKNNHNEEPKEQTTENEEKNDDKAIESDDGRMKKPGSPMVNEVCEETVSEKAEYEERLKLSDSSSIALNENEIASKDEDQENEQELYMSEKDQGGGDDVTSSQNAPSEDIKEITTGQQATKVDYFEGQGLNARPKEIVKEETQDISIDAQEVSEQCENGAKDKKEQPEDNVNKIVHSCLEIEQEEDIEEIKPSVETEEITKQQELLDAITTDACISTQIESQEETTEHEEKDEEEAIESDDGRKEESHIPSVKEVCEETSSEKVTSEEEVKLSDNSSMKLNEKAIAILSKDEDREKEQRVNMLEEDQGEDDITCSHDESFEGGLQENYHSEGNQPKFFKAKREDIEEIKSSFEEKTEQQGLLHAITTEVGISTQTEPKEETTENEEGNEEKAIESDDGRTKKSGSPMVNEVCEEETMSEKAKSKEGLKLSDDSSIVLNENEKASKDEDQENEQKLYMSEKDQGVGDDVTSSQNMSNEDIKETTSINAQEASEHCENGAKDKREQPEDSVNKIVHSCSEIKQEEDTEEIKPSVETEEKKGQQPLLHAITTDACISTQTESQVETTKHEEEAIESDDGRKEESDRPSVKKVCEETSSEKVASEEEVQFFDNSSIKLNEKAIVILSNDEDQEKEQEVNMSEKDQCVDDVTCSQDATFLEDLQAMNYDGEGKEPKFVETRESIEKDTEHFKSNVKEQQGLPHAITTDVCISTQTESQEETTKNEKKNEKEAIESDDGRKKKSNSPLVKELCKENGLEKAEFEEIKLSDSSNMKLNEKAIAILSRDEDQEKEQELNMKEKDQGEVEVTCSQDIASEEDLQGKSYDGEGNEPEFVGTRESIKEDTKVIRPSVETDEKMEQQGLQRALTTDVCMSVQTGSQKVNTENEESIESNGGRKEKFVIPFVEEVYEETGPDKAESKEGIKHSDSSTMKLVEKAIATFSKDEDQEKEQEVNISANGQGKDNVTSSQNEASEDDLHKKNYHDEGNEPKFFITTESIEEDTEETRYSVETKEKMEQQGLLHAITTEVNISTQTKPEEETTENEEGNGGKAIKSDDGQIEKSGRPLVEEVCDKTRLEKAESKEGLTLSKSSTVALNKKEIASKDEDQEKEQELNTLEKYQGDDDVTSSQNATCQDIKETLAGQHATTVAYLEEQDLNGRPREILKEEIEDKSIDAQEASKQCENEARDKSEQKPKESVNKTVHSSSEIVEGNIKDEADAGNKKEEVYFKQSKYEAGEDGDGIECETVGGTQMISPENENEATADVSKSNEGIPQDVEMSYDKAGSPLAEETEDEKLNKKEDQYMDLETHMEKGNVNEKIGEEHFYVTHEQTSIDASEQEKNISGELQARVEKELQEDRRDHKLEDSGPENPSTTTQDILEAAGEKTTMMPEKITEQDFQESQSKTNKEIEAKLDAANQADRTEDRSEMKDEVVLTVKMSSELRQPKEQNVEEIQACLTKTTSEKTEDKITKKDEDLSHDSIDDTNDNITKEEKCFLDARTRNIGISTLEHEPIEEQNDGLDEVSKETSKDLNETTAVEPQGDVMPSSSLRTSTEDASNSGKSKAESENLPTEDLESVSDVQILGVVPKSEDSNLKEECLISATTMYVDEENGTVTKEISSDEKTEHTTEIKQVGEHLSIVCLDAIIIEEEQGRSSEKENITGDGRSVEDLYQDSIVDETISENRPQEMKEEDVQQTPTKSDEMKWSDTDREAKVLENLEPYEERKLAYESMTDDRINETTQQPEKSYITTEKNITQLEQIGENNSLQEKRDMEEDVTPENQLNITEDCSKMVKDVILTEEVPLEIQKAKGKNEFKEQIVDEDSYSTELQKKSTENQKDKAHEISYPDPVPVGNPEVTEVRVDAQIGQEDLQAAEDISCESKASSTIQALKTDMKEGVEKSVRTSGVVKNDSVDEAPKEERIPSLEDAATLEPQVYLSNMESTASPSEKLPIQGSVCDVRIPEVVANSEDSKVKEECLVLTTAEYTDENNVKKEHKIITNEISSAEKQKKEQTTESKQVAEPSISCLDAVLIEEELGRSSEHENTTDEGRLVTDPYQDSVADRTISESCPQDTEEENVKQAPIKSDEAKRSDTNTEEKALTKEDLEPHGELNPTSESVIEDQINETTPQPQKSDIGTENNVKCQSVQSQLEHIGGKDSKAGKEDLEEDGILTPENQIKSTQDLIETKNEVIMTEEIKKVPVEIQKENGINKFKEEIVEEDSCSKELQKTSNQKEKANENLELHGELKLTSESMIEDQVTETKPQPEQPDITSENIMKYQTLESKLEHTSEKDLVDGKRDMEEDVTLAPENQINSTESQNETMKNVILTEEIEQAAVETEKEKGRNEVKEQVSEEDNCPTELEKTSASNQKELANEIAYSKPIPAGNTEVTEVTAESQIELENIQAAEGLSCLSKASSTIGASKVEMNNGTGQTVTIIGEVKVDEASKDERIPALEDAKALELQVNSPDIESTDTPSNGQDSLKLREDTPWSTQETIEEKGVLISQLTDREILEGDIENRKKAPNLEFEKKEKDDELISEIQTPEAILRMEMKEEHLEATNNKCETLMGGLSSEKLLDELEEIDAKKDIEAIARGEDKAIEESYQDAVAEATVHERLPQTEEKLVSMVPHEELTSPMDEDQTNELVLETDKTKVEHSSINNKDQNPELMEEEFTKTFSEDQRSIKERYIQEEGQGNFGVENKEAKSGNEVVEDVVVNEVLLEVEKAKESKSIQGNINEEASCMHDQLTSATDEVCQIKRLNSSLNELLETKGSVEDAENLKLMAEAHNLKVETFTVMKGPNEDMKQNVEKTNDIVASEFGRLENMVTEEKIIKADAHKEKETLAEPEADDPTKTTSDSISSSMEQDIEVRSEESRGHGDMHKLEEKPTEVFEITSEVAEIVPERREVSAILTENLQESSPKMLLEKHDPEITTSIEKIEDEIKDKDETLVNMYLSTSTKEVAWLSNEKTGELQVSTLNSEIDEGKQNGPGDMLNKEREVHPQEQISNINFVDSPSDVEIREQGELMHCDSQEPSEDNTLLSQNDKKIEDSFILLSGEKEIIQGVDKKFEEAPVIDVQKHEKDLDYTTKGRIVDVVSNAECSEIEQQHLDTKEATLGSINQENQSEQKKESDQNIESEIPIEKVPKQTIAPKQIANEFLVMSVAKEEDRRNYPQDHSKEQEYSGERTYQDLEAVKEPFQTEKLSDKVKKADSINIQEETMSKGNLHDEETEERTTITEATVNLHHRENGDETNHKGTSTEAAIPIEDAKSSDVVLQCDMDVPVPKCASTRNPEIRSAGLEVPSVLDAIADKTGYNKDSNNKTDEAYEAEQGVLKEDIHLESTCDRSKTTEEVPGMEQEPFNLPLTRERSMELDAPVTPGTAATEDLKISQKYVADDLIKINQNQPEIQKYEVSDCSVDEQLPNKPHQNESIESKPLTGNIDASHKQGEPTAKSLNAEAEDLKATKASGTEPQCSSEIFKEEKKMSNEKEKPKTAEPAKNLFADLLHESTKGNSEVAENLIEEREPALIKDQVDKEETGDSGVRTNEENEEGEDDEDSQKMGSCSDPPVMVEASKDMEVKVHKKSHNILSGVGSKVKHSIAKVKKAITGKSSHPKPPSPKERD